MRPRFRMRASIVTRACALFRSINIGFAVYTRVRGPSVGEPRDPRVVKKKRGGEKKKRGGKKIRDGNATPPRVRGITRNQSTSEPVNRICFSRQKRKEKCGAAQEMFKRRINRVATAIVSPRFPFPLSGTQRLLERFGDRRTRNVGALEKNGAAMEKSSFRRHDEGSTTVYFVELL